MPGAIGSIFRFLARFIAREFNNLEGDERQKACLQAANISVFCKQFFPILEINSRSVEIVLDAVFPFSIRKALGTKMPLRLKVGKGFQA